MTVADGTVGHRKRTGREEHPTGDRPSSRRCSPTTKQSLTRQGTGEARTAIVAGYSDVCDVQHRRLPTGRTPRAHRLRAGNLCAGPAAKDRGLAAWSSFEMVKKYAAVAPRERRDRTRQVRGRLWPLLTSAAPSATTIWEGRTVSGAAAGLFKRRR